MNLAELDAADNFRKKGLTKLVKIAKQKAKFKPKKELTKKDFTPKFTARGTSHREYPIIPNSTLVEMIGPERWEIILKYTKEKHDGTLMLGCHEQGKGAFVYVGEKCLGSLADVEVKAIKFSKKKGKKNVKVRNHNSSHKRSSSSARTNKRKGK